MTHVAGPPLAARLFAVAGLAVAIVAAIGAIAWRIADPAPVVADTFGFGDASLVGFCVLGITWAAVGALLVLRLPGNAVGWVMVVIGICHPVAALAAAVTFSAVADGPEAALTAAVAAWIATASAAVGGLIFVVGLIYPTGRGHTRAWDLAIRLGAVAMAIVLAVGTIFRPGPLQVFASIDNPFGFGPDLRVLLGPNPSEGIAAGLVVLFPIVVWSIVSRYQMAGTVERQQLKWFVVSLLASVAGVAFAAIAAVLTDRTPEIGLAVFGFAGALVPLAIGVAILRHHLYDIDRIISRTLSYAIVVGILGLAFGAVMFGLQIATVSILSGGSSILVAVSTIVVFALFQPVMRRVRQAVDHRFDRDRYDAERTIDAFTKQLRDETDLRAVADDLDSTVRSALRPGSASLWLRSHPTPTHDFVTIPGHAPDTVRVR